MEEIEDNVSCVDIGLDVSEGEWFQYFGSHIDQGSGDIMYHKPVEYARAKIRSTAPFLEERLKKQKRKADNVLNPKSKQMEKVTFFVEQPFEILMAETDDMYDYAIMELEGFRNKKTADPIACTRENKIALRRNEVFKRYFERCQQVLHGDVELEEKN